MHSGNTNEQLTLQPLEKKILKDFSLSKFVVCTDAGLSSISNRKFNNQGERAFITTQSVKKLKKHLKEWALSKEEWRLEGVSKTFDLSKIEECFRLLKSDFKARPVYLSRDDRIKAHFTTCFLSLTLYRYLEQRLEGEFTSTDIITHLRNMNFYLVPGEGYVPTYTRTNFTDALHNSFGFRTDYEIVTMAQMKKIFRETKK